MNCIKAAYRLRLRLKFRYFVCIIILLSIPVFKIISWILGILLTASMEAQKPGPRYPPAKGQVWPLPQHEVKTEDFYTYDPASFQFTVTGKTCNLLKRAHSRYESEIMLLHEIVRKAQQEHYPTGDPSGHNTGNATGHNTGNATGHNTGNATGQHRHTHGPSDPNYKGVLTELRVKLAHECETLPYLGMDEAYNLNISVKSTLSSNSIWGIIRGLETFSQLFYLSDDYNEMRINLTTILDFPRYPHRGLLLDTSRHFISVDNILTTLHAMSINKMNVFHWHIVDDESFPYESNAFPDLSKKGAFDETATYSVDQIKSIIDYATDRGIRVLPEIDIPGHTRSWGEAYPDILTKCYNGAKYTGLGPMNPINNATYSLLRRLFEELQELFPDKYIHVGGDEVNLKCWASNPEIKLYMAKHKVSVRQMHAMFMRQVIPLLSNKSLPIVWQEVFDNNVLLRKGTLVQVWKYDWTTEMVEVLSAGHRVVFSSAWYLDILHKKSDWQAMYDEDPRSLVSARLANGIVGGEACMWGEFVDDTNVISRVWPRASAVAERLWSAARRRSPLEEHRMEEHACRMRRRGVNAQPPSGPGFCRLQDHLKSEQKIKHFTRSIIL